MAKRKSSPGDATGRKREELEKEHATERKRREKEITTITEREAEERDQTVVDYTNGTQGYAQDGGERGGPLTVTQHPGQSGAGTLNADGTMTTFGGKATVKTNSTAISTDMPPGGVESPSNVPGEVPQGQRVRNTVDTVNAARVADPEAGRFGAVRGEDDVQDVGYQYVEQPEVVIRVNADIEQMTFGTGNHYDFEEGRQYKVPKALADHLEEKGFVWH